MNTKAIWEYLRQAGEVDKQAVRVLKAIVAVTLDDEMWARTGFTIDLIDDTKLIASAHGVSLVGEYAQVIYGDGVDSELRGAIEFRKNEQGKGVGDPLHSVIFDRFGNVSISGSSELKDPLLHQYNEAAAKARRQLTTHLVGAIQTLLRRV
ncbi:hypothetical protein [Cupriavidus sp. UME77]|uniref:hypothetical protein n=1 Tax=Cupriavidus sp. UME77 TaxID=1862321 RepID=UPI0016017A39|nr:hypothetical protein [Cupriavidus sp. UME77]MBB1630296.1 hypothetical protein [Cupriavidus sp. UME77]